MKIPLSKKLKKRLHIETAMLQDEVIDIIYSIEENAVLHGGTAICRCYEGNRFSEDLDFYFPAEESLEDELITKLKERNLELVKYKKTQTVVFAKVSNRDVEVRLEVNFISRKKQFIVKPYEKADGSFMDIFTLSADELLVEKINAYKSRRLIRDIYDIYHLSKYVEKEQEIKENVKNFLSKLEKAADEENLKVIVYAGAVPSFNQMVDALRSRFSI